MHRTPRIKVCGVTLLGDLDFLAASGVDSIGLNFVPHSPRCVNYQLGQQLSRRAAELGLLRVAVVMNPTVEQLNELLSLVEVDVVQLHGTESPDLATACQGTPIIKAVSWSGRSEEAALVRAWLPLVESGELVAWLIDAHAPVAGGGTGKTACWDLLQPRPLDLRGIPLVLAGGLTPENVCQALQTTSAEGVDTASGVELRPGIKSPERVQLFVQNLPREWKISNDN